MLVKDFRIDDYAHAKTLLYPKTTQAVCLDTRLELDEAGQIWLRFHTSRIVCWTSDGGIFLYSRGYKTTTIKGQLNRCCPPGVSVWQRKFEWFVGNHSDPIGVLFTEGIDVSKLGKD